MADFIDLKEVRAGKKKVFSYEGHNKQSIVKGLIGAAIILFFLSLSTFIDLHIDSRWFDVLGYGQVFWTNLDTKLILFGAGFFPSFKVFRLSA